MSQINWESDKLVRLDEYIYDYFVKRNLNATAKAFQAEVNVSTNPVAVNPPGGFLLKWWSTFWGTFIASSNVNLSEMAQIYNNNNQQHELPMQMQQMFNQSHVQKQRQHHLRMFSQSHPQRQQQQQWQNVDDAALQQMMMMMSDTGGQLLNPNYASMLQGQTLHAISGNTQQLPLSANIGLEQLYAGFLQEESLMGSSQPFNHFGLHQQLMAQTQQNLISPSANNPNDGSSLQLSLMPEVMNPNQQYLAQQEQLWMKYSGNQLQDKSSVPGGSMPNIYLGSEQAPEGQIGRKDKQVMSLPLEGATDIAGPGMSVSGASSFAPDLTNIRRCKFEDPVLVFTNSSGVDCCDFSYDGKLIATGGRDRKVMLWCTASYARKHKLEEHSEWITDVRFSPNMPRLATASLDKTVKVWNYDQPRQSIRTFRHSSAVMSVDFHVRNGNFICSADQKELRCWNVTNGDCIWTFKEVGVTRIRNQPQIGMVLAAARENVVHIVQVGADKFLRRLDAHKGNIRCICWERSGRYLASVSEDVINVWRFDSEAKVDRFGKLRCSDTGTKSHICVFHPASYASPVLVISCQAGLMSCEVSENNNTMTRLVQERVVSAMAASSSNGWFVTVTGGMYVKLWK